MSGPTTTSDIDSDCYLLRFLTSTSYDLQVLVRRVFVCVYSVSFVCRSCVVHVTLSLIIICVMYGAMDKPHTRYTRRRSFGLAQSSMLGCVSFTRPRSAPS